jgi:drug/metabolite transporter (DMT)-like permease
MSGRPGFAGIALVAAISVLWGVNWPALKIGLAEIPPWTFRAVMLGLSGPALLACARLAGSSIRVPAGEWRPLVAVSSMMIVAWMVVSSYGIRMIPSSDAVILAYSMPVWSALFGALILHERFTARRALGLAAGLGGVATLLSRSLDAFGDALVGSLLVAASAAMWGLGIVMHKAVRWRMATGAVAGWQVSIGAVPCAILALAFEPFDPAAVGWPAWGALAFNATVIGVAGYILWFRIMSLYSAAVASIGILMVPIIGVMLGAALLGEAVGWRELAALALIVCAIGLVLFEAERPA